MPNQLLDDYYFEQPQREKDIKQLKIYTFFFIIICCFFFAFIRVYYITTILDKEWNPKESNGNFMNLILSGLLYIDLFLLVEIALVLLTTKSLRIILLKQFMKGYQNTKVESFQILFYTLKKILYGIVFSVFFVLVEWLFLIPISWFIRTVFALIWYSASFVFGITLDDSTYYIDIVLFTVGAMAVGLFLFLYFVFKRFIETKAT